MGTVLCLAVLVVLAASVLCAVTVSRLSTPTPSGQRDPGAYQPAPDL